MTTKKSKIEGAEEAPLHLIYEVAVVQYAPLAVSSATIKTSADAVILLRKIFPAERIAYKEMMYVLLLNKRNTCIGFCGSPWTLLCYMVEGKGSKDFSIAKQFCAENPALAHQLLDKITEASITYLKMQVIAGVNTVQLFDSWGGLLSPDWYSRFSLPYLQKLTNAIREEVPVILFAKGAWFALKDLSNTGASALGLDWTTPAAFAREVCGPDTVFQGNLDPSILLADVKTVQAETLKMIKSFGHAKHIVNLGHGVLPQTPVDSAKAFVETAKAFEYGRTANL